MDANDGTYDCIVVGAGSAGCVLAGRLSEDPSLRVLLLEAGPRDTSPWIHLPIGYGKTMWDERLNWRFHTDPDPNMNGRRIYWPRGKALGGSSSINGLIYIRGQREDYDRWAAGATTTSCRTFASRRATSAAPTPSTAPTARSRSATCARTTP